MTITELTKAEIQSIIKEEIRLALSGCNPKGNEELLSRRDAARYFGVTFPTLNTWEKKGYLKPIRIGSRVYFKKSNLIV